MNTRRQRVRDQDIEVGCILFLPSESYMHDLRCMWSDVSGHTCHNHGNCVLTRQGHHHPVVIIGKHYGLEENNPDRLILSFVQMTHDSPANPSTSGPSMFSPYGHYERTHTMGRLSFPHRYRSRYWFRGLEFLRRGPGNFRIPHVFFTRPHNLRTMAEGPAARAFDSRLDEGSYLRLMQRLNLQPKAYVPDDYWNNPGPPPSSSGDGSPRNGLSPTSSDLKEGSGGGSFNQPRGHHVANRKFMKSHTKFHTAVPILEPAPRGRRPDITIPSLAPCNAAIKKQDNQDKALNDVEVQSEAIVAY